MTPAERVTEFAPRIRAALIHRPLPDSVEFEDALQEGLLAAWKAAEADDAPERGDGLLIVAARRAALNLARGRKAAGTTGYRRTVPKDEVVSLEALLEAASVQATGADRGEAGEESADDGAEHPAALTVSGWEDVAETRTAVRAAVAALPAARDREIVWRLFWEGRSAVDAAREIGVSSSLVTARWRDSIRPALREALADLAA